MTSSKLPENLRLLALMAHPHDLTWVLGTCAHHIERGDSVTAVAASGGTRTHNEKLYDELRKAPEERSKEIMEESPEAYAEEKAQQLREGCRLFGITDVRTLPFPDHPLEVTDELVRALTEILYEVRPHVILTHAPHARMDKGQANIMQDDHVSTGLAIHRAMDSVARPDVARERSPHRVAAVYYTGVDVSFDDIDVNVDITDQFANRVKAEALFTTQAHTPEWAERRMAIEIGSWGRRSRVRYAEPFVRARAGLERCLPVTDLDLEIAQESKAEYLARVSAGGSGGDTG